MVFEIATGALGTCCVVNFAYSSTLKKDSLTDPLTGLYNRKFLKRIEKMRASGDRFYVIGCDIDHFKKVNDTYGHASGDVVLKSFAQLLKNHFKGDTDYVVRFGGEEFFIFSKVTSEDYTPEVVFQRVGELRQKVKDLEILSSQMDLIKITSSFGICSDTEKKISEAIECADKYLYEAKKTGRDKVVMGE